MDAWLLNLMIDYCPSLMSLSSTGQLPKTLEHVGSLKIYNCYSLTCIVRGQLPSSLRKLSVMNCTTLKCLSDNTEDVGTSSLSSSSAMHRENIDNARISQLEDLEIMDCDSLESLPEGLHNLNFLRIIKCDCLFSFPDEGLPSTIRNVNISDCGNLKALPNGIHTLNSLQTLTISHCPRITFPEEGLPTNLTSLTVVGPNIWKPLMAWGLHKLTSLKYLNIEWGWHGPFLTSHSTIEGSDAESFPEEGMLPPSLTRLVICEFAKLKYLSSQAFQNLTSLQHLEISGCPYLTSFPEEGLPSSLSVLTIVRCSLLKEKCKKNEGQEWSKIAHIPGIRIL
ncbi:putative disease resistance protein At3g14460 [Pistacia vera]|uniref:putative disease resistance protein At3g14460 n=1 Tax=Pistacia vera TaxID=55513 RepID=UPI001263C874|nr:putative disease resistance protein At3g14460 [Pistacia vera]